MDLNVNQRVDRALADNQRTQNIILIMSASIFAMGLLLGFRRCKSQFRRAKT